MRRRLGAGRLRIDGVGTAPYDEIVDAVFEIALSVAPPQPVAVRFVLAEQQFGSVIADQSHRGQLRVDRNDFAAADLAKQWFLDTGFPRPDISSPELRQDVERRRLAAAVGRDDFHKNIVVTRLRVSDRDIEVAVIVKGAGIEQLEFRIVDAAAAVLFDEPRIRKFRLRIFVQHPHPAVARCPVEVVVQLLDIFAVVAFGIGQTEQALFEDWIALVPQSETEAEVELVVAETRDTILAPAVGAAAGMVMRQVFPGIPVLAVILADGAPLPLTEIGAPVAPRCAHAGLIETTCLGSFCQNLALSLRCFHRHRSTPSRRSFLELPSDGVRSQFPSVMESMCWR